VELAARYCSLCVKEGEAEGELPKQAVIFVNCLKEGFEQAVQVGQRAI